MGGRGSSHRLGLRLGLSLRLGLGLALGRWLDLGCWLRCGEELNVCLLVQTTGESVHRCGGRRLDFRRQVGHLGYCAGRARQLGREHTQRQGGTSRREGTAAHGTRHSAPAPMRTPAHVPRDTEACSDGAGCVTGVSTSSPPTHSPLRSTPFCGGGESACCDSLHPVRGQCT